MGKSIRERIGDVFRRYVTDDDELSAVLGGAPILTALTLDSLTTLDLITEIEVEFGKRFDMDGIEQTLETIDSLAAFLDT